MEFVSSSPLQFQLLPIQLVKRRYFSESAGLAYLQRVGIRSALLAAGVDASQYLVCTPIINKSSTHST